MKDKTRDSLPIQRQIKSIGMVEIHSPSSRKPIDVNDKPHDGLVFWRGGSLIIE